MQNIKETSYLSVVVPLQKITKRSIGYIESLHNTLSKHFLHYEVILVCNGDSAKLSQLDLDIFKKYTQSTFVLNLSHKHAKEVAAYVGLEYAKGDYILEIEQMDEDFDGSLLPSLMAEVAKGSDVVSVVSKKPQPLMTRLFYVLMKKTATVPVDFETEKMRLVTRRALNKLFALKQRVKYRKLLYLYTGFARSVVYPEAEYKKLNEQSASTFEKVGLAVDVLTSYTSIIMRVTIGFALLFALMSILGGVYSLVIYFYKDVTIEGWTTLMLFVSFGFSGLFLILSMVIKYLELIMRETQSAPIYTVSSVKICFDNEVKDHV